MNNDQNLFDLTIDQQSSSLLSETARWGKFIAIVGFILCLILVLFSFFAGAMMASQLPSSSAGLGGAYTMGIILVPLLWFFPCFYLFQFSSKMQTAIRRNDQALLNASFRNLKSCFKFIGILTLVIVSFYVIVFMLTMVSLF